MNILCLPSEVLEYIWSIQDISYLDVLNLAQVCSKFHEISRSNEIWKQKLLQQWPALLDFYPHGQPSDWKVEFIRRYRCGIHVKQKVSSMSAEHYQKEEVSKEAFSDLQAVGMDDETNLLLIIDELMGIIHDDHEHQNLTTKYYAEKTLRYIRQLHLKKEWLRFLALPPEEQLLEKGAILLAQWCQPSSLVPEQKILHELDNLAESVREDLRQRYPDHPACKTPDEVPMFLDESSMGPTQSRVALEALNRLLYENLGFRGNEEDYYESFNSYIDKVLDRKLGIPISLSTVYIAIARRVGVRCDAVNFPNHFLIKFKEHPTLSKEEAFTYIDVFNKGRFLAVKQCLELIGMPASLSSKSEMFESVTPVAILTLAVLSPEYSGKPKSISYLLVPCRHSSPGHQQVMERMVRNLVHIGRQQGQMGDGLAALRNAIELNLILCPDDVHSCILLARVYLHLKINVNEVLEMLDQQTERNPAAGNGPLGYLALNARMLRDEQNSEEEEPIVPKLRSKHWRVHYSVGLIMKHKRYDYYCVISGWDEKCEASQEWMLQMSVNNLPNQGHQPFYNVLVEDGSNRYAAQENLSLADDPKPITHREVGKYFREFCGTYYMPNFEKSQRYPEDLAATLTFVSGKYG